ncbi:MAG: DNA mismatch repair endonuclease MutL [Flavipsychrobacter sp.]|nr:DNA mismatch repair endonuclease MutL [Flavipsychrobacter sp.]
MADEIQLLSEHIANQIAAGEVVQRPASAVKELLENAIDAGATEIQLIIKDAGKELIQVTDNGKGMSPTDARMSFERHATSKIKNIEDLFKIRTMGFRGEALASIAAVAQVEMKTRQAISETGTRIVIEGTEVKSQEPCAFNPGTTIMVKNLFYNVPARRNFLKSNTTEYRNILDEFTRVALAHPQITFRLWNNGAEQYRLDGDTLKARIVGLLGNTYEKNLVPVEQETDILKINGFVGKPQASTRTRGMQFFFINGRFIRNSYLNHAVIQAYEGLIEKDSFPFYVLFLEIDPAKVDVNVHPTKQEVKFEDDRLMYTYLMAAVKHSLARYNIAPSLDFTLNAEIQQMPAVRMPFTEQQQEETRKGYLFNTFSDKGQAHAIERNDSLKHWKALYEIAQTPTAANIASAVPDETETPPMQATILSGSQTEGKGRGSMMLVHGNMLAATVKSGMMLIHIRRAQERICYERLLREWNNESAASQRILFPASYELAPQDALLLQEALPDLVRMGFDISPFGKNSFVVQGVPPGLQAGEEKNVLDEVVEQLKHESPDAVGRRTDMLLANMARRLSTNIQAVLQPEGQQALIDELFACSQPELTPDGRKTFVMLRKEELEQMLG